MHKILGLGEDAEALYRYILVDGPLPVAQFTLPAEVAVIEQLRAEGLVYGDDQLTAARPDLTLGRRVLERQQALLAAQAHLDELEQLFRANTRTGAEGPVEVLSDAGQVQRVFAQIEDGARTELLSFVTAPYRVVTGDTPPPLVEEDHPRCRILIEEQAFRDGAVVAAAEHSQERGCEVRVIDRLPCKLLIGDRVRALVPRSAGSHMPVLLVQQGTLMDSLVALFESYWDRGLPRSSAWRNNGTDASRPTEQEITILRHLLRGATEAKIAATLGISKRTVIRRIQQLMERAGVETRFQLGVRAERNGWLSRVLEATSRR